MSESTQYLTSEKLQEFTKELEFLKTDKRKQVAESLEYAKKLGDLSENAEYHEARQEQAEVEDRISHLDNLLKHAVVLDHKQGDVVSIGSTVKVKKEGDGEARVYKIVGSEEADMSAGKVSNLSPLGSALLGKRKNDTVMVSAPKGQTKYSLVSIE